MNLDPPLPLVSMVVRSMARPELEASVASLLAQDYPKLEIIVIDATGGKHPPLTLQPRLSGHTLRLVRGTQQLPRAQAGNAGLDQVSGELFGFLDDDDTVDPDHLSRLVSAAQQYPEALCVYGKARILNELGVTRSIHGLPFNRAIMYTGPLFHWQAALFRCRVLELGCRFDTHLDVSEDRDLVAQIAHHGEMQFVDLCTFNYRPDLGTSGTGSGENRNMLRLTRDNQFLHAKWAGDGIYHLARASLWANKAVSAYRRGDRAQAHSQFEKVLQHYPDDPNALNGLARLALEARNPREAEARASRACEINPAAGEYHLTHAYSLLALGHYEAARTALIMAARTPQLRAAAEQLLARLPAQSATTAAVGNNTSPAKPGLTPCPCGSGKPHKQCCGKSDVDVQPSTASPPPDELQRAADHLTRGEADAAWQLLRALTPEDATPPGCFAAARMCHELGEVPRALTFLDHAPGNHREVIAFAHTCGLSLNRDLYRASCSERIRSMMNAFAENAKNSPHRREPLHLVAAFDLMGGSENRGIELFERLSPHVECTLWSVGAGAVHARWAGYPIYPINDARGLGPRNGTVVLLGTWFDTSPWLEKHPFSRIVVAHNIDLPERLIKLLVNIADNPHHPRVSLTVPSGRFGSLSGLEGVAQVEYPIVNSARFRRQAAVRAGRSLVIGRHQRAERLKFHPNDPAFFRRLIAGRHTVRLLGGTPMRGAFAKDADTGPELLPEGSEAAQEFLASLDCFVYRNHPHLYETGGTSILEAMAMELPVIVFDDRCGVAEIIDDGKNGFLVNTEDEAMAVIEGLADDIDLRQRIGHAARARVLDIMAQQDQRLLPYYLHE